VHNVWKGVPQWLSKGITFFNVGVNQRKCYIL